MRKTLNFDFELKALSEDGTFEGLLSVYGNVDHAGDVVEAGAFTSTIARNKGVVPLLWQHDSREPIGLLELTDTAEGLQVKGSIDLEVQRGREAYSLAKKKIVKGLSIGFNTIKDAMQGKLRRLMELDLWEGSLVTFPANPLALVSTVKADGEKAAVDFAQALDYERLGSIRYQMMSALRSALDSIVWDSQLSTDEKVTAAGTTIGQFSETYLGVLPDVLNMLDEYYKAAAPGETKAGKVLSAASRKSIEDVLALHTEQMSWHKKATDILQALLDAAEPAAKASTFDPAILTAVSTEIVQALTAQ